MEERKVWHRRQASIGATLAMVTAIYGVVTGIGALTIRLTAPSFLAWLSTARAEDIKRQIKAETAPSEKAISAIVQDKIDELSAEVERLQAQKSRDPAHFADADADKLSLAKSRLAKLQAAK